MLPFRQCRGVPALQSIRSYSTTSLINHKHLSASSPTPYSEAEAIQEDHRARFLASKADPSLRVPRPLLLSFEAQPTFTLGRRQEALPQHHVDRLQRPLRTRLANRSPELDDEFQPLVTKTNRGGLTTYHGPGQLVFWPVIDMHSPLYAKFGVASYAAHLESTTRRFLRDIFGIRTYTNPDEPGVWVKTDGAERKIAALGVHHRRYVTALGTAVNIDIPVTGGEDVNPWARFVPCGLEGKLVTSALQEGATGQFEMEKLARLWAERFEEGLVDPAKRVYDEA
ncbi:hypothetical protein VHEMI04119 [[Torrubiella] hemipterigena]|uniref:Octanoyltransferase n=1 Tax=[Torrubiella] hemipterigena TaxID=1531966 RepID=A0A0A1TD00_9HYPO|nr:hypothetical protein VHEMI04119 [[Torrubiella] hemipterigena]